MDIGQADAAGDDTVNVDRVPDQTSKVIRAREAGNSTDSDNADPVQASELKPISTGVADAVENGNSRADEGRDIPEQTAPDAGGCELSQLRERRGTSTRSTLQRQRRKDRGEGQDALTC